MALDAKYGKIDVPNRPDDMPCFVLLASDEHAVALLARYRNFMDAIEQDSPLRPTPEWMEGMDGLIADFADWRTANPTLMKVAD